MPPKHGGPSGAPKAAAARKEVAREVVAEVKKEGLLSKVAKAAAPVAVEAARAIHPLLGAVADMFVANKRKLAATEGKVSLMQAAGARYAGHKGSHKPEFVAGGPSEEESEEPVSAAVAVGQESRNMVWQEEKHFSSTSTAEEKTIVMGSQLGPLVTSNGVGLITLAAAAGTADCASNYCPVGVDTFNGRLAAYGNFFSSYELLWLRWMYYTLTSATATDTGFATGFTWDRDTTGVPTGTFVLTAGMTPSYVGPLWQSAAALEIVAKDERRILFTEQDASAGINLAWTEAGLIHFWPSGTGASTTFNKTLGLFKLEFAFALYNPCIPLGITFNMTAKMVVLFKRWVRSLSFEERADFALCNRKKALWALHSLAEYEDALTTRARRCQIDRQPVEWTSPPEESHDDSSSASSACASSVGSRPRAMPGSAAAAAASALGTVVAGNSASFRSGRSVTGTG